MRGLINPIFQGTGGKGAEHCNLGRYQAYNYMTHVFFFNFIKHNVKHKLVNKWVLVIDRIRISITRGED